MSLNASLRNRIRRLEARSGLTPPSVVGVLLRPGVSLPEARQRIDEASAIAPRVYIANLAGLRLRKD